MAKLKSIDFKNMNLTALQAYKYKLKELKTWAQIKSPKALQPALSYTLGWLSPELLGTSFRMTEISDFSMKATVTADTLNLDSHSEIPQGLILNAALELAKTFINRHLTDTYYVITSSEIVISKKLKWNENVNLFLDAKEAALDDFFSELQQDKSTLLQLTVRIQPGSGKKMGPKYDSVEIKLNCTATNLLK